MIPNKRLTDNHALKLLALGVLILLFSRPLAADSIVLKSGEVFVGRLLRMDDSEASIQLRSGGVLSFRSYRIARIRKRSRPGHPGAEYIFGEHGLERNDGLVPVAKKPKEEPGKSGSPASGVEPGKAGEGKKAPDLSDFPLHAQKSPEKISPPDPRIKDMEKGYSLIPPPGFKPWVDPKLTSITRGFIDPATQSNLTITSFDTRQDLDTIKDGIVLGLPQKRKSKVVRASRHDLEGPRGYRGWMLSIENSLSSNLIHQLQLLAKSGDRVYMVTYSASARSYPTFARAFRESLETFRIEENGLASMKKELMDDPEKLKKILEKSRDGQKGTQKSLSEIDVEKFRVDPQKMIEKVDERMRGARKFDPF